MRRPSQLWVLSGSIMLVSSALGVVCGEGEQLTTEAYFARMEGTFDGMRERLGSLSGEYHDRIGSGEMASPEAEVVLVRERDEAFVDVFRDVREELDRINPPPEVTAVHDRYVPALEGLIRAKDEFHASEVYGQFLLDVANAGIRQRLSNAETAEEVNAALDELRVMTPADAGMDEAGERLGESCSALKEIASANESGARLWCEL
jgi:hypothetical protein